MSPRRIVAMLVVLSMMVSGPGLVWPAGAQPVPGAPPAPDAGQVTEGSVDVTPARVSYMKGEISFWRPGAQDWTAAALNTPLSPGDMLYTGKDGTVEVQLGPAAFARATYNTQIGLDNHDPNFIQLRVTGGQAALDLHQLPAGSTVEVDTPNAAFTIQSAGYYRVDVGQDTTSFATHRGGVAVATPAGGAAAPIGTEQQMVITGVDSSQLAIGAAPQLTAWDNWNYQRTSYLLRPASARYVSTTMYGTEALDQYGTWRTAENYGSVWVPSGVPAGWVPYSTGRWIWDPRFGWTWLDEAPWGWAPYHYGRWVFVGDYWAWAPGPVVVQAVYAPALVVFLGGVTVSVGRPICWAPLAWGEPLVPWWGRPGFVGVATWRGWGGPRVVNNVVVNQKTTVNVTNITVYRNVSVANAVVGVPADRFGHGEVRPARINQADAQQLRPVHGGLEARPVAASVMPTTGRAVKPPAALHERAVVATRAPHDIAPTLSAQGLATTAAPAPAPRLVPAPKRAALPPGGAGEPRTGRGVAPEGPGRERPAQPGSEERRGTVERPVPPAPGSPRTAPPPQPGPGPEPRRGPAVERSTPPPPPGVPGMATPPPQPRPAPEQYRGPAVERSTPPPPPGAPGMAPPPPQPRPAPEQYRGPGVERRGPPPGPDAPGPDPRRGNTAERPTPPRPEPRTPPSPPQTAPEPPRGNGGERPAPPNSSRQVTPPPPNMSGVEAWRGYRAQRATPPLASAPRALAEPVHPAAGPEPRRGSAVIDRDASAPAGSPRQAWLPPAQPAPAPEQHRDVAAQRSALPRPSPRVDHPQPSAHQAPDGHQEQKERHQ